MANVTVCSTTDYLITFNSDASSIDSFGIKFGTLPRGLVAQTSPSGTALDFPSNAPRFASQSFVHLHCDSTTNDIASWQVFGSEKAKLSASGELTLASGSLRLPILQSLPSNPVEGMLVAWLDSGGSGNVYLAAYLDSAWRYSSAL